MRRAPILLLAAYGPCGARGGCEGWCNEWTCWQPACEDCAVETGCPAKPPPPPTMPPQPAMPPFDWNRTNGGIEFETIGGRIYANGRQFSIKGVNWFGSESRAGPPLGLDKHPLSWYMSWLRSNSFNAIRLLFNHEMILSDPDLEPPNEELYGKGASWEAPELAHFKYLAMFERICEIAAEHGIIILLAAHRLQPKEWPGNGLWYNNHIREGNALESWTKIAKRFCGYWNVFAVDLMNEPHASSWGKGSPQTDWGLAAGRIGDHVLSKCSRWLLFIQGVGASPGAPGMDDAGAGVWWGENLAGVKQQPVSVVDQSKVVYSPHTYGPSVFEQPYFADEHFPQNIYFIWEERFLFVRELTGSAVVIGEIGGHYKGKDRDWQDWAIGYAADNGVGVFYFALLVGHGAEKDDTAAVAPTGSKKSSPQLAETGDAATVASSAQLGADKNEERLRLVAFGTSMLVLSVLVALANCLWRRARADASRGKTNSKNAKSRSYARGQRVSAIDYADEDGLLNEERAAAGESSPVLSSSTPKKKRKKKNKNGSVFEGFRLTK